MFYVVNLETRNILTYRDGNRAVYDTAPAAHQDAFFAQRHLGYAHTVISITDSVADSLGREVKPWLRNKAHSAV